MTHDPTKRPWRVEDDGTIHSSAKGRLLTAVPLASSWKEDAWCGDDATPESTANARLIVKAVNAHDGLVEALGRIERGDYVIHGAGCTSCPEIEWYDADPRDIARQALAALENNDEHD
jgi:hypothetical protein